MTITVNMCARVLAIFAAAPISLAVAAPAALADTADTVYFSYGPEVNCAITGDGTVGCDVSPGYWLSLPVADRSIPVPFVPVRQVVIDQPWLPAHPGSAIGAFTLPGGNPFLGTIKTGEGYASIWVDHAGATCTITGFHYSGPGLSCSSKGHSFALYSDHDGVRGGIYMR
ncbi:hypothetical protein [Nocardia arthritidis]|uniref:Uncharacterized protein n=1 Tax=Nocardia arthritidis TaxID=228602 RepID=A0A6G9YAQ2_9NOCA|nr:hypothetical protein [Nocardia arthritidis]QIS10123.1 hypothetical protein F5544_11145 [Nocardia arthritidis]